MKRLRRFAIVVSLLVGAFVFLAIYLSHVPTVESAPCRACNDVVQEGLLLSVCDLDEQKLRSRIVRIKGTFYNDAGQLFFENEKCRVLVGIAKPKRGCGGAWEKFQMVTGTGTWYDGSAEITAIGVMGLIPAPNFYQGERGFILQCLESVHKEPGRRERRNFAIHRLLPHSDPLD